MRKGGIKVDSITKLKRKLIVDLVPGVRHKWLYLVGDGITYVCLKPFVDKINDSLYCFVDDYKIRSVLSEVLK